MSLLLQAGPSLDGIRHPLNNPWVQDHVCRERNKAKARVFMVAMINIRAKNCQTCSDDHWLSVCAVRLAPQLEILILFNFNGLRHPGLAKLTTWNKGSSLGASTALGAEKSPCRNSDGAGPVESFCVSTSVKLSFLEETPGWTAHDAS